MSSLEIYESFEKLKQNEKEEKDYRIHYRHGISGILVMAPHGGGIEPGTTEIANAVAGKKHSFYSFEGLKPHGNLKLHITSRRFDEPIGVNLSESSETLLVIHGCKGEERVVYIGGRNRILRQRVETSLINASFSVQEDPRFPGLHHRNRYFDKIEFISVSVYYVLNIFLCRNYIVSIQNFVF